MASSILHQAGLDESPFQLTLGSWHSIHRLIERHIRNMGVVFEKEPASADSRREYFSNVPIWRYLGQQRYH